MKRAIALAGLCFALITGPVWAEDPFGVTVTGGGNTVTVGGSTIYDLVEKSIRAEDQFGVFQNSDHQTILRYADVGNALNVSLNAANTALTLNIPITGFSKTFTGTDEDDLENQLEEFLKKDGMKVFQDFLKAIDARSMVGVTDGNPSAATATHATSMFMDQAFDAGGSEPPADSKDEGAEDGYRVARLSSLRPEFSLINAGRFSGTAWGLDVPVLKKSLGFDNRLSLALRVPLRYREIENARSGSAGIDLALPIQVIKPKWDNGLTLLPTSGGEVLYKERLDGWAWRVTPGVGLMGAASVDFLAGSAMVAEALSSALEWTHGDFSLTMGNYASVVQAANFEVDGFSVGGQINQQILKNGLQAAWRPDPRHSFKAYGIATNFLQEAAVPNYWTLGLEYAYRNSLYQPDERELDPYLSIGGYADLADKDYSNVGVRLGMGFTF